MPPSSSSDPSSARVQPFSIHPAQLSDVPALARAAVDAYEGNALNSFIAPHRHAYPDDHHANVMDRVRGRMLATRNRTYLARRTPEVREAARDGDGGNDDDDGSWRKGGGMVRSGKPGEATEKEETDEPFAYIAFTRLGDDAGARRIIAEKWTLTLYVLGWYYFLRAAIINYFYPNRAGDAAAFKQFHGWAAADTARYWGDGKHANRWYVQSFVVRKEWQGKGVGRALMGKCLDMADREGVPVALESTSEGEGMYLRMGFELQGRFQENFGDEGGGFMVRWPRKML